MRLSNRSRRRSLITVCVVTAMLLLAGHARGDTVLLAWDVADEDLWSIDTANSISSTFIGGGNSSFVAEIEYGFGVVYGADTSPTDSNLHLINPSSGQIFDTLNLAYPPEGNVITALEFVDGILFAGLTTRGGGSTFLAAIDLASGIVTVIGDTGVTSPFGGLAYDVANTTLYGISAGGSDAVLYTLDMMTGVATSVGPVTVGGFSFQATALEFGDDDVLYTAAAMRDALFGHLLSIDPKTALAMDLGDAGLTQGVVGLTFQDDDAVSADTTLAAWDTSAEDLWTIATAPPISSTFIGGGNSSIVAEIEFDDGVIYGSDTFENTDLHMIDPTTGLIFDTLTLTFPPQGDTLTALEFVNGTLYGGLTRERGAPTYLVTVDLATGAVSVVGATGVNVPLGGLAYQTTTDTMFAISSGGSAPTLYTVDLGSGAATAVASVTFGGQPFWATALEFGGDGLLYTAPARRDPLFGHLLVVNTVNGVASDLGDAGMDQGPVALTFMGAAGDAIFADGFESGDTTAWSEQTP